MPQPTCENNRAIRHSSPNRNRHPACGRVPIPEWARFELQRGPRGVSQSSAAWKASSMLADVVEVGQTIAFCRLPSVGPMADDKKRSSAPLITVSSWKYKLQMRTTGKFSARPIAVTRSHLILMCTTAGALVLCAATYGQRGFLGYPR